MRSARVAAWRALVALERGRVDRLDAAFDRRGLSAKDRGLALELARGVERSRLWLDFLIDGLVERTPPKDPHVRVALRLGVYQLIRLTRVPSYAAVTETVGLLQRGRGFVNALLRRLSRQIEARQPDPSKPRTEVGLANGRTLVLPEGCELPDPESEPAAHCAVLHGLPRFLVERWASVHGPSEAARIAAAADRTPALILRANTLHGDGAALQKVLAEEAIQSLCLDHPQLVEWEAGASPFASAAYRAGWFVAQDPTALRAVEAVDAGAGDTVVDLCAGPGTKTSWLAERVRPDGRVHAYDVSEARRKPIRDNATRLGLSDVIVVHDDAAALPVADRVLVDVPCSNTGVLARRVEVRRRLRPESFDELARNQVALLRRGLELLRPGGTAVYSTCSIEPEENEQVAHAVLAPGLRLVRDQVTLPDPPRHDGGYVAVLEKT